MKKIFLSAFIFAAMLGVSACNNGDYDANPATTNNSSNPLNNGSNGGGNNGGGNNGGTGSGGAISGFTSTGTDPMSATVDGAAFLADDQAMVTTAFGIMTASGFSNAGPSISVSVPTSPTIGSGVNCNGTYSVTYDDGNGNIYTTSFNGGSGAIAISQNDTAYLKGYFHCTVANMSGATKSITDGYFKVHK